MQNIFQDIVKKNDVSLQARILHAFLSSAKFSKVTFQRIFIHAINLKNTSNDRDILKHTACLLLI